MRKFWLVFFLLIGAGLILLGCSAPASTPTPQETMDAFVTEASATMVGEITPTSEPSQSTAEIEPTQAPAVQDACVACHSDQQRITDTAKKEEAGESESKGVG